MHKAAPNHLTLNDWSLGWDNSTSLLQVDPRSLTDCMNFNLTTTKGLEKRGGMAKLYSTSAGEAAVKTIYEYSAPNGTKYVLVALDTKIRAYYGSAWNDWKISLTAGKRFSFATHSGFCYGVNGTDANLKFWMDAGGLHAWGVGIAAPAAAPTVADGGAGALTGKYKYVYCYYRTTHKSFMGNPSPESAEITVTSRHVHIPVVASTDAQVDKIVLYRTFNLFGDGADSSQFWKVGEYTNTTATLNDELADSGLGAEVEYDNTVPPVAKFVCLHKDRVFYLNCPSEEDGGSLIRWSKIGKGDSAPSTNYQYFDRTDGTGEEITGGASFGDYQVVFKRNKLGVLEGDFSNFRVVDYGIGCIAPWAILTLEDKVIFLSEEGWKAFDGVSIYDISSKINSFLAQGGYITLSEKENYSVAYYPLRKQFQFLLNTSVAQPPMITVGSFLVPLLYIDKGIDEQKSENIVSWTYHRYPNHTITTLGAYTDTNGISRIIAGTSAGYIYLLDTGATDGTHNIECNLQTGWLNLGVPESYIKVLRLAYIAYMTSLETTIDVAIDADFTPDVTGGTLTGADAAYCGYTYCGYAYGGMAGYLNELLRLSALGALFRLNLNNDSGQALSLYSVTFHFRVGGHRE